MGHGSGFSKLIASAAQGLRRKLGETFAVLVAAIASLAVHAHYVLPGLGEGDAARFARIAFIWHVLGKVSFDIGYQSRTSTLYLQLEKLALDHGLPMRSLPTVVNSVSVAFGTATSVALYVLFRKLTTRPIAAAATLIYALTPGFWLGNVYGMPTVPGLFFFVVALIWFEAAARTKPDSPRLGLLGRLLAATLCLALAMSLKSDLVLGGGAFVGLALTRPIQRFRFVGYGVAVVVLGTLASIGYSHLVILPVDVADTASGGLIEFFKDWNKTFAVSLDALTTDTNNATISRCVGGLLFSVIVFAHLFGLVSGGRLRKQALLSLLWGLPPILAWGIRFGNSARHNVPAFPPLILFTVVVMFELCRQETRRAALLVASTMLASYCSNFSGDDSLRPQSNLLRLSEVMINYSVRNHTRARALAETPSPKLAVIVGYADPYTEFEVLSAAKHPKLDIKGPLILDDDGKITVLDSSAYRRKISPHALARRYQREGFETVSLSYRF